MKRFTDNGDGTVTDTTTGLMWPVATTAKNVTHKGAVKACTALDIAGHSDWRMPTVEELFALADRTRTSPAIDIAFFPDTKNDWYWSSTPCAWSSGSAWLVHFGSGYANSNGRSYEACVRAVRAVSAGQ